ncbi:MAG: hypothetical protein IJO56_05960 [Oscillospiraceae bacterium]|nr:hypothetical protein [Oscillospiraceae bacterium]
MRKKLNLQDLMEKKENNEKVYAVIDQTKGDWFEDIFSSEKEAIDYADYEWGIMTESDKAYRIAYFIAVGEVDEDGAFDQNTCDVLKEYK